MYTTSRRHTDRSSRRPSVRGNAHGASLTQPLSTWRATCVTEVATTLSGNRLAATPEEAKQRKSAISLLWPSRRPVTAWDVSNETSPRTPGQLLRELLESR